MDGRGCNHHEASEALATLFLTNNIGACMHSLNQKYKESGHVVSLPPLFKYPTYGPDGACNSNH